MSNGAVFHYAYAGEALTRLHVCSCATTAAGHKYPYIIGSGTASAGDYAVNVVCSATSFTENMFQGGQLVVSSQVAGLEATQNLLIKSHPVATTGQTIEMKLLTPVQTTFTSQSKCGLIRNPFYGVEKMDFTAVNHPIGITNIAVTTNYYFWLQTWGPCAGINDAAPPVVGGPVAVSSTNQGGISEHVVTTIAAGIYPPIGMCGPYASLDDETSPIFLMLVP